MRTAANGANSVQPDLSDAIRPAPPMSQKVEPRIWANRASDMDRIVRQHCTRAHRKGTRMPAKKTTEKSPFKFKHKGKTYTLPSANGGALDVPGGVVQDAIMHPENRALQTRLSLFMLDASTASEAAKTALREMPAGEMLEVIEDWMGESGGSSAPSGSTEGPSSTT